MEQMMIFKKMDPRRLRENPESKNDFHTYEYKHCGMLMKFQWKVKGSLESKPGVGGGRYHMAHVDIHLQNHCDESGHLSIQ